MTSAPESPADQDVFHIEVECLIEGLYRRWGFDFRDYARASLRRRVARHLSDAGYSRMADLQHDMMRDQHAAQRLVQGLTINVTDMFRDPTFFRILRAQVLPELATHPVIRVWVAGCATGEEAYSVAMLLRDAQLLERSVIYATDINTRVLDQAKKGIYHQRVWEHALQNCELAGCSSAAFGTVVSGYEHVLMDDALRSAIVFAQHDLVTDQSFGEMQLILCRNVLIYFRRELQNKVLALFYRSLDLGGFLGLGSKESLLHFPGREHLKVVDEEMRLFQRMPAGPVV